jgi:phospholipase A1
MKYIIFALILLTTLFTVVFADTVSSSIDSNLFTSSPPTQKSALATRLAEQEAAGLNPYGIGLYQPTYILPFYYTQSPDQAVYQGQTPDNQAVMNLELKAQFSIAIPVLSNLFYNRNSLNIGYTQLSYWQVYANSQYFRETDYEPELFFTRQEANDFSWRLGIVHQSNGLGGEFERSWNRAYAEGIYSDEHWMVSVKPWALIFQEESSDLHNPDITHFLGHGQLQVAYKVGDNTLSFMSRNNIESGFSRGAEELDWSFPLRGHFRGFIQFFSGYGQSLIEYNHYTSSFGIGIALNDWI